MSIGVLRTDATEAEETDKTHGSSSLATCVRSTPSSKRKFVRISGSGARRRKCVGPRLRKKRIGLCWSLNREKLRLAPRLLRSIRWGTLPRRRGPERIRTDRRSRKRRPGSPRTPMWLPRLVIRERTGSAGISGIMGLVEKAEAAHSPTTRICVKESWKRRDQEKALMVRIQQRIQDSVRKVEAETGRRVEVRAEKPPAGFPRKIAGRTKARNLALSSTKREPVRRGRQM